MRPHQVTLAQTLKLAPSVPLSILLILAVWVGILWVRGLIVAFCKGVEGVVPYRFL